MKKPLLFSLFVWILLLALPWTRPTALLDWRGATLEPLRESHASWAPFDAPYQPEREFYGYYYSGANYGQPSADAIGDEFDQNGFRVAAPFASLLRSRDRDVLTWCARSTTEPTAIARNLEILHRRFPRDAAILAWTCGAQMFRLSSSTRVPGPLTAPNPNWSVKVKGPGSLRIDLSPATKAKWDALAVRARQGQKMEPRNGFWWWLETACLIGARRDELVWPVLRVGKTKPLYDDHSLDNRLTLRRAHRQVLGTVPMPFYLNGDPGQWQFQGRWYEITQQICENVMGARLQKRHKTALEGGRDLVMMGALMRRSQNGPGYSLAIEQMALQNALPRSVALFKPVAPNTRTTVLIGGVTSLVRYASQQNRADLVRELTGEWNKETKVRRAVIAKFSAARAGGSSKIEGVPDSLVAMAAGTRNIGAMLVQTLPLAIVWLAVLSLVSLAFKRRRATELEAISPWTRGLGWSAFALLTLLGAQVVFNQLTWTYVAKTMTGTTATYWGFDFILPRLLSLLPIWAWAFPVAVLLVGARWATLLASRRAGGKTPIVHRLRSLLDSSDERTGALDLGPILELIGGAAMWGTAILALAAWFYLPLQSPRAFSEGQIIYGGIDGFALVAFALAAIAPTFFLRPKGFKPRDLWRAHRETMRRFLAAHIALTTLLYMLLSLGGAFFQARFEAKWEQVNALTSTTK